MLMTLCSWKLFLNCFIVAGGDQSRAVLGDTWSGAVGAAQQPEVPNTDHHPDVTHHSAQGLNRIEAKPSGFHGPSGVFTLCPTWGESSKGPAGDGESFRKQQQNKEKKNHLFSAYKKSQLSQREEKKGREVDAPHKEKKMC